MGVNNYESFATSCLMDAWLDIDDWGSSPDAETNNTVVYKINNNYYSKSAIDSIDLSAANTTDGLDISDGNSNVVYVTVDDTGTVEAYVWVQWSSLNEIEHPNINLNDKCIIGRIWVSNSTGGTITLGTKNLDDSSVTSLFEDVRWPIL